MLRLGKGGGYQASKWLKVQVLCDADELAQLFELLHPFRIYPLGGFVQNPCPPIAHGAFLQEYGSWIEGLKKKQLPLDVQLKRLLACAWTAHDEALELQEVAGERYLVRVAQPVIQVQSHFFTYSTLDKVFHSMSMGMGSIFWGIQISYPQIYQDPITQELLEGADSPNAELFQKVRQWSRDVTRATPFIAEGQKIHVPMRLGKKCFSWIENHPQLSEGLHVQTQSLSTH